MCIILDANCFSEYVNDKPDMKPVKTWVEYEGGKIVFSEEEQIKKEFGHHKKMFSLLNTYKNIGRVKMLNKVKVENTIKELNNNKDLKSNDIHLLAHARVGEITLIVTHDQKLQHDFQRIIDKGKIYTSAKHKKLLEEVKCL